MSLIVPKEGATQEEINAWIVDTQEKYNKMEIDLQQKTDREKELLNENNKLYSRITGRKEDTKEEQEKEHDVPLCISKEMYNKLDDNLKAELEDILENEEDDD